MSQIVYNEEKYKMSLVTLVLSFIGIIYMTTQVPWNPLQVIIYSEFVALLLISISYADCQMVAKRVLELTQ